MRNFLLGLFMTVSLFMTCEVIYMNDLLEKEKQHSKVILESSNKIINLMREVDRLKNYLKKEES